MHPRKLVAVLAAGAMTAGLGLVAGPATAAGLSHSGISPLAAHLGRQALPAGDGWGSAGAGTTGGSTATADQVYVVDSRAELVDAVAGDTPKIIYVRGTIGGFEAPDGTLLTCDDLADPDYSLEAYLATYDPAVWGWDEEPSGPLEDARERSMRNQQRQTVINVGSNTTLIGLRGARLEHLTLMFDRVDNVIVRNLTFFDAADCFPQWDPTDGSAGNWNSNWDLVSVRRGENFWFDRNTFLSPSDPLPVHFGREFEVYDGQLDITHTANLVTVSHNVFRDNDKTMLIGSTNNPNSGDPGRLNVTLRHNLFDGIGQRGPRVRFGQVDVYNNYYRLETTGQLSYSYSWGVGVQSKTYAENNFFDLGGVDPARIIGEFDGTAITERGTWARDGRGRGRPISVLGAYNAANETQLGDDVGWTPELRRGRALPAVVVPAVVGLTAGAGRLPL